MNKQATHLSYYRNLPFLAEVRKDPLCAELFPIMCGYHERRFNWFDDGPRRIEDWVLLYALGGEGELRFKTQTYTLRAGDIALLPGGEAHDYRSAPGVVWSYWWVHFGGKSVAAYLKALGWADAPHPPVAHAGLHDDVIELFREFAGPLTGMDVARHHVHNALILRLLLSRLSRHIEARRPAPEHHLAMESLLRLMKSRLDASLSVPEMARCVNMSTPHFYRRFKQQTGTTPSLYFLRMKMIHACERLDASSERIGDIGVALGFCSPYHFSRMFKQVVGMSPSDYRRHHKR